MSTSARPTLVSSAPRQPASAVPAPPTAAFPPATPTRSHRADSDRWPTCKRADSPTRAPSTADLADSVADTVPVSADSAAATVPVSVDSDAAKIFFFFLCLPTLGVTEIHYTYLRRKIKQMAPGLDYFSLRC